MPRSDFDKKPGDKHGQRRPPSSYPPTETYVPKWLDRRIRALDEGLKWEGKFYQPPVGSLMRKPGSQNPRK